MNSNLRRDTQLREFFRPEFINRLDEVLTYNALEAGQLRAIVDVQLERLSRHLAERILAGELAAGDTAANDFDGERFALIRRRPEPEPVGF